MFTVKRTAPDRIDIEFSGKLDAEQMKAALDAFVAESEGIEHGKMVYRIGAFDWPTLSAVMVELKRLPQLFKVVRAFDRCAVVADQKWIRKAGEIEGALFPGLDIKAFEPGEDAAAEAWLAAD